MGSARTGSTNMLDNHHNSMESNIVRPIKSTGSGHPGVLARLHAIMPNPRNSLPSRNNTLAQLANMPADGPSHGPSTTSTGFLKLRIITWNMHDSLPKGKLEDLLGTFPPYVPCSDDEHDKLRIPNMTERDEHPYHLVVVAGQECPTVSGIPMGLTAVKFKEKEKHKDPQGKPDENPFKKGKEGKTKWKALSLEVDSPSSITPAASVTEFNPSNNAHTATSGWSWILDEWFCHGLGQKMVNMDTSTASELYDSQALSVENQQYAQMPSSHNLHASHTQKDKSGKKQAKEAKKDKRKDVTGPYELLTKERLMGIYIAVFIYRDLKPFVRGISKSSVPAGLIGGRFGNKGGVGVSINLAGTTLLFVNAHLAAHEDRVMDRVANMTKIKSELEVDDYLPSDDPRTVAEDLTDRFDHTFVFGDLNFRLDITRLHADWLISRQEYGQALAFDQLKALIRDKEAFVGFNEGEIDFPPTFKYDVMRNAKRSKSGVSKEQIKNHRMKRTVQLTSVEERNGEPPLFQQESSSEDEHELGEKDHNISADIDDRNSATSTRTSMRSNLDSTPDMADSDSYHSPYQTSGFDAYTYTSVGTKALIKRATSKARNKWLSLLSSSSVSTGKSTSRPIYKSRRSVSASFSDRLSSKISRSYSKSSEVKNESIISEEQSARRDGEELRHASSSKSAKSFRDADQVSVRNGKDRSLHYADCDKGVYDSSSKQRVPSWCDRILWKSTVRVEPEFDDIVLKSRSGIGQRVLQRVLHAFGPLPIRTRTMSLFSLTGLPVEESLTPRQLSDEEQSSIDRLPTSAVLQSEDSAVANIVPAASHPWITSTSKDLLHPKANVPLLKSKSVDPSVDVPRATLDVDKRLRLGRSNSISHIISTPHAQPDLPDDLESQGNSALWKGTTRRNSGITSRGWRLLPFLSRETNSSDVPPTTNSNFEQTRERSQSVTRQHHKGEVAVLGYSSLDDQAMRRLEGRSDHRPVIGSFAIYL